MNLIACFHDGLLFSPFKLKVRRHIFTYSVVAAGCYVSHRVSCIVAFVVGSWNVRM